ncbi:MAG: CTP synthase [Defluviitaleaceae bacterium]|nr:CTP synthase [Defluviitaleaceae bacterium]MCL2835549.1 CTP synthase [Defluviitaleaceae bacterium]
MGSKGRKYIFVTGGVLSGLGKGTMAASLGRLLKARGYRVTNLKFDAYINVDPGTMSLSRHGEVFVTDDGTECDLDIGNYERFIDENLPGESSVTIGKVYLSVIERERSRGYEGEDIQVIPHITDEIKKRIREAAESSGAEIAIVEIGGTVGDIESLPLLEAIRQMAFDESRGNVMFIHLTLVPLMQKSGEMKSKPTQHSVKELLSFGIQPDIIVCRSEQPVNEALKDKIALFCNVLRERVIQNTDAECIYDVPLQLEQEGLAKLVCDRLSIPYAEPDLDEWRGFCRRRREASTPVKIALVSKYTETQDAYLSVTEALLHASVKAGLKLDLCRLSAEDLVNPDGLSLLQSAEGIIIPGGFGERGVPGMIRAAGYARQNRVPFLGIGLGMHSAVFEYARAVLDRPDAYSAEYGETTTPIIDIIPESRNKRATGSMRRGASEITFTPNSLISASYAASTAIERHRHRYEINPAYRDALSDAGMLTTASSQNGARAEAVELPASVHPWFVGVQYHPEFKSRPNRPHPLFVEFMSAAALKDY